MNPWNLSAGDLLIFGIVLHLIADFPLQNDWMANNKAKRCIFKHRILLELTSVKHGPFAVHETTYWFIRHPAAYVHASIHAFFLALVFGWPAFFIALAHLVIDCRWIVEKWSQLIKQTQPTGKAVDVHLQPDVHQLAAELETRYGRPSFQTVYDIGTEVRIWTDQTFHITCLLVAALLIA